MDYAFDRLFISTLLIDHAELLLRQAGVGGDEAFFLWAGTLAGGDAFVSTMIVPRTDVAGAHGTVSADATAGLLTALDERDLVPVAQVHSHPRRAFLSDEDAIRPVVDALGFISIIVPAFGFGDVADVDTWSAHEYRGNQRWAELTADERQRRLVVDDSIIRID